MTMWYTVGIRVGRRNEQIPVEAEDGLIAALKVKMEHPDAVVTYVRKRNVRGDRRQMNAKSVDERAAASEPALTPARSGG